MAAIKENISISGVCGRPRSKGWGNMKRGLQTRQAKFGAIGKKFESRMGAGLVNRDKRLVVKWWLVEMSL